MSELRIVDDRLTNVTTAIEALQRLSGLELETEPGHDREEQNRQLDVSLEPETLPHVEQRADRKGGTRVPSTNWVASVVHESGVALSRQEIHEGFKARFGYPDTWRNPANAINNAIGRAVERDLIRERDGRYVPGSPEAFQQQVPAGHFYGRGEHA